MKARSFVLNEARAAHTCTVCGAAIAIGDIHKRYKIGDEKHHVCAMNVEPCTSSTFKNVKHEIAELKRDGRIDKKKAAAELALLGQHNDLSAREDFAFWVQSTTLGGFDVYEWSVSSRPRDVRAFAERVMPRFKAMLRAELVAEGLLPTGEVRA